MLLKIGGTSVQTTYVTADHLGSGNLVINTAGTVLIKQSFSAYGYRRSSNWAGPLSSTSSDYSTIAGTTRRGYTDAFHEMMDNVNLIHMNGRVYDPVIGRFISADPLRISSGIQPLNSYGYVGNSPLSLTDPTGFQSTEYSDKPEEALAEVTVGHDRLPDPTNDDQYNGVIAVTPAQLVSDFGMSSDSVVVRPRKPDTKSPRSSQNAD